MEILILLFSLISMDRSQKIPTRFFLNLNFFIGLVTIKHMLKILPMKQHFIGL
jgi:hypothetical protein